MHRLIYILLLISSVLVAQTARESVEFNWVNKSEKSIKGAQHHTFYSQANKAEVGFNVYLPEHYQKNSNSRYPVIYVLHGGGGNERSGLTRIRSLELAIKKKIIPPTILVMPNGGKGSVYLDSFDGSYMVKTMIIKELIPHIDKEFRTIPERRARAIQGFSMGGSGSTKLALLHPHIFSSFTNFAGSGLLRVDFDPSDKNQTRKIRYFAPKHRMLGDDPEFWKENIGYAIVEKNRETISEKLGIRIVFGKKDKGLQGAQEFSAFLKSLKIDHEFDLHEGGHNWGTEKNALDTYAFHNKHFKLSEQELRDLD